MRITIERVSHGTGFKVVHHGVYGRSSVLAGRSKRWSVAHYATLDAATAAHPHATPVGCDAPCEDGVEWAEPWHSQDGSLADLSGLPTTPPAWFDPADAGERWDDDY